MFRRKATPTQRIVGYCHQASLVLGQDVQIGCVSPIIFFERTNRLRTSVDVNILIQSTQSLKKRHVDPTSPKKAQENQSRAGAELCARTLFSDPVAAIDNVGPSIFVFKYVVLVSMPVETEIVRGLIAAPLKYVDDASTTAR
jgi:hypothetical protein